MTAGETFTGYKIDLKIYRVDLARCCQDQVFFWKPVFSLQPAQSPEQGAGGCIRCTRVPGTRMLRGGRDRRRADANELAADVDGQRVGCGPHVHRACAADAGHQYV